MGMGHCQFGVSGFAMAVGQATLHCGLFWLQRLGTEKVYDGSIIGNGIIIRESLDFRCWSVGPLLVGLIRGGQRWGQG